MSKQSSTKTKVFQMRVAERFDEVVRDAAEGLGVMNSEGAVPPNSAVIHLALEACSPLEIAKRELVSFVRVAQHLGTAVNGAMLIKWLQVVVVVVVDEGRSDGSRASGAKDQSLATSAFHDSVGEMLIIPARCFSVGEAWRADTLFPHEFADQGDNLPDAPTEAAFDEREARLRDHVHMHLTSRRQVFVPPGHARTYFATATIGRRGIDHAVPFGFEGESPDYINLAMQLGIWREFVKSEKASARKSRRRVVGDGPSAA